MVKIKIRTVNPMRERFENLHQFLRLSIKGWESPNV